MTIGRTRWWGHALVVGACGLAALACSAVKDDAAPDAAPSDAGAVDAEPDGDDIGLGRTKDSGPPAPDVPVGKACTTNAECGEGFCLTDPEFPQGYCSVTCTALIEVGDTCPVAAVCAEVGPSVAVCLDTCDGTKRCRAGYHCEPIDEQTGACLPQCQKDRDCGSIDKRCNTNSGLCEAWPSGEFPVGASCTGDGQCKSQLCVKTAGYTNGYCQDLCPGGVTSGKMCSTTPADGGAATGPGGVCFTAAAPGGGGTVDLCWADCTTTLDCRPGYVCSVEGGFVTADKVGACVPKCQNFQCASGLVCDPLGFCTTPPAANPTYTVEKIALGASPTDSRVASTVNKTFTVPPDTVSFTIVGATSPMAELLPVKVLAPNGRKLLDIQDPRATTFRAIGFSDYVFGALYPNDPNLPMTRGQYSFSYAADRPTTATVDVLVKRGPTPTAGKLPLTLWFAKTSYPRSAPIKAATAASEPVFQAAIGKWREIYASMGITLDPALIQYREVPAGQYDKLGVIDSDEELAELFAVANTSTDEGLNMFFIDQFNQPGAGGLLGLSAGIPGVPSYPGLPHAGVAVALYPLYTTNDADERADFAATMAHEAGHYLGLFHTTERRGTTFDPLDDTPQCPAQQLDTNKDRFVSTRECLGADASNFMFWTSDPKVVLAEKTTPMQKFVLLRSPSVK